MDTAITFRKKAPLNPGKVIKEKADMSATFVDSKDPGQPKLDGGYDSTADTLKHIQIVRNLIGYVMRDLLARSENHDRAKMETPEKDIFDEFTPKLKGSTYGSDEYKGFLKSMSVALDHHYKTYRHHPEHFQNGMRGMNLIDLMEMMVDWIAATKRHDDGDIMVSIEKNQERFGYDDELKQILMNTASYMNLL